MKSLLDSFLAKAERLIYLRKLAKLSRKDVAEIANVSFSTYKGWENARFGGIPQKRASLLIEIFQSQGIKCSIEWLMDGHGEPPKKDLYYQAAKFQEALILPTPQSLETIEELSIKAELEFFCNNNNWDTLFLVVPEDSMEPYFFQNDLVAGIKTLVDDFDKILGLNCIVRTKNNKILLRQVQSGSTDGLFTLLNLNINNNLQPIIHNIALIEIAPVIWLRKRTTLLLKNHYKK